jgi:ribosomal protein S18 acetylase RimI-like enzyme
LVQIRQLSVDDRPAAVVLWRTAGLVRPWNDPEADFDRAVAGVNSAVLGAVDENDLVGTVMVGEDGHRGWVYYVATAPSHRGRGLGRAVMDAAEGWLAARGVAKLNLMVRSDNADVAGFYASLGYKVEGVAVYSRRLSSDR